MLVVVLVLFVLAVLVVFVERVFVRLVERFSLVVNYTKSPIEVNILTIITSYIIAIIINLVNQSHRDLFGTGFIKDKLFHVHLLNI